MNLFTGCPSLLKQWIREGYKLTVGMDIKKCWIWKYIKEERNKQYQVKTKVNKQCGICVY